MFKCSKCEAQESEIVFLREEVRRLTDRLLAVVNPMALQAVQLAPLNAEDFYGSESDETIEYGSVYGQKTIVTKLKQ